MKKLLVIESPNKIKTLQKYLPADFEIIATIGHIRDLSTYGLGFDTKTMDPRWVVPKPSKTGEKPKKEIIEMIRQKANNASEIYLASDPDREGEAISWHVYEVLDDADRKKCKRIVFNEISKDAVNNALQHPRDIDKQWVESQFARRIIDRMIGFKLSKLVQNQLHAESAGRVQSVALKFIEDREKEIEAFKSTKWWTLDIILQNQTPLILRKINEKLVNKLKFKELKEVSGIDFLDQNDAQKVKESLGDEYEIYSIDEPKYYHRFPKEPYKTSTLQQDAINKLGLSSRNITSIAQHLYEGIKIGDEQIALISYPRTDSTRVSDAFKDTVKSFINHNYGKEYLLDEESKKSSKKAKATVKIQDAHEAIRPVNISITPESIKDKVKRNDYALYKLIWIRTVAAFMAPAKYRQIDIRFINNGNKFYASSRENIFEGYRKIYTHYEDSDRTHSLPLREFEIGKKFKANSIEITEHESVPPARYTQASLIATLEKSGIGRPSTYNTMANVALNRGYAHMDTKKAYVPTVLGRKVITELENYFAGIINKEFTKNMEEHLDFIANGKEAYKEYLFNFWTTFEKEVSMAFSKIEKTKVEDELVGRECPECKSNLVYRYSHRGHNRFIGCSNYPKCHHIESLEQPKLLEQNCPECGKQLIERRSRRRNSKPFVGCTGFPACKYVQYDNSNKPAEGSEDETKSKKGSSKKADDKKDSSSKSKKSDE